jgi:serine/threonine-protein kinase PknG
VSTVEASDPPLLEQVFLSELFGHPEAIVTPSPRDAAPITSSAGRPGLVLLSGRGEDERDLMRYRGAIGAVSGVAAAALVVAGMTTGTGSRSEQPTVSAQGNPPGQGGSGGGGSFPGPGGVATQPGTSGATPGSSPAATAGAATAPIAHFAASTATTPATPAVVVGEPVPAPVAVAPSPPAPGGGTTPSGPAPAGGGSVLTPVFVTAGSTVASVGSTVTAASNDLAHVVPAISPVTGLLGSVGATVTSLGQSVAGA